MLLLPVRRRRRRTREVEASGGEFFICLKMRQWWVFSELNNRKFLHIIPEIEAFDAMNNWKKINKRNFYSSSSINLPAAGMKTIKVLKNPVRENRAVRIDTIKNSFVVFAKMLVNFRYCFMLQLNISISTLCALTLLLKELQSSSSRRSISQVPPEPSAVI